jgi:hypothetical protein
MQKIILKPIYFEYKVHYKQAAEELDKLVYVMSENEDLYMLSHIPILGVKMTIIWIFLKGELMRQLNILSQRELVAIEFEKVLRVWILKVSCVVDCTEEEHALNRRSEFMIVKK